MNPSKPTALAAFLLATTCLSTTPGRAQSADIPLQVVSLGIGNNAYQRLVVNVGVSGGASHPYLFDTGSALFNLPQSFIPTTIGTLANGASYVYGDGNGYYGNLSAVPSISFFAPGASTASVVLPTSTGGYIVNEVTTHLLGSNAGNNATSTITVTDPKDPKHPTTYYVDPNYPTGVAGVPPIEKTIYGTFGAGNFAPIIGNGTVPGGTAFTAVTVGSILGQSTASGYVVAANATATTQTASTCNPCVMLGLTPQLRAQFTSFAPWNPGTGIGPSFPNAGVSGSATGANGSTEFGVSFLYTATVNGVTTSWYGPTLLDAGTQNLNLHTGANVSALETKVAGYLDAGATVTMTSTVAGSAATVFKAQSAATAPDTLQVSLGSNSNTILVGQNQTPGIAFFLANSVLYDLANQATGYSSSFVTDAPINAPFTVNASDGPLGLAGAIANGPGTAPATTLTLNAGAAATLTNTNTYTGATTIAPGAQLVVAGPGSISTSSLVTNNGTLDLSGVVPAQLLAPGPTNLALTGLAGSGQVNLGSQALTLTNATGGFSGVIADGGLYGGTGASLVVAGGTQTLTGANTYTGGTTITGGATLAVNADAALGAPTGTLTFSNGTLLALGNIASTRPVVVTAQGGTVNANGYQVSFAGAFTALGDLVSIGSVTHSGSSSVTGTLTLGDGQLSADGNLSAANVVVGPTATLRGTGTVTGNTTVYGTYAPGDSPGTLTHKGSLTLTAGATTKVDIDGSGTLKGGGNYSRVVVRSGVFNSAGTLRPVLRGITGTASNAYVPPLGQSFAIVSAEGGVNGSYARLVQPDGMAQGTRFDALYGPTAISLIVTPSSYGNLAAVGLALTANQAAVGSALDAVRPAAGVRLTGAQAALYAPLYTLGVSSLAPTLDQLAPTIYGDRLMGARDAFHLLGTAIDTELEARRGGGQPHRQAQIAAGPFDGTFWMSGLGQFETVHAQGAPGYSGSNAGAAVGLDAPLLPWLTAGLALGYTSSDTHDRTGAHVSGDGVQVQAYASARRGIGFIEAQMGGGVLEGTAYRPTGYNGLIGQGQTNGTFGGGSVRAGVHLESDGWRFEPSVSLAGVGLRQGGTTETLAGGGGLAIGRSSLSSVQSVVGGRVERSFALSATTALVPALRLGWLHEYADTRASVSAAFPGGAPFVVRSAPIGRDAAVVGVGATVQTGGPLAVFADYTGTLNGHGNVQNVTGGVRYTW